MLTITNNTCGGQPVSMNNIKTTSNLAKKYNPNQILTSGEVSTRLLEESKGLKGIKISLLGSCRHVVGLVKDYKRINTLKKCLVLPEGLIDECRFLFKFSSNKFFQQLNTFFVTLFCFILKK